MSTWSATTHLPTQAIAQASRDGAPNGFNGVSRKLGRFAWGGVASQDGGVFDTFGAASAWSAQVEYRPPVGDGLGACAIQVIDHGSHREVTIDCTHSSGQKGLAKKLLKGVVGALQAADPAIR